jgi:hypothetical protein
MRHRGGTNKNVVSSVTGTLSKLTELLSDEPTAGRHKPLAGQPLIPIQKVPTHETTEVVERVEPAEETTAEVVTEQAQERNETRELAVQVTPVTAPRSLPTTVQWKAGHTPRVFAAALLLFAVAGTSALGLRYAETRGSDEFISVVIGIGVVVGLWALLIASTPQVVSLRGSILTVRNSSGSERFDLADGLQPVDVIGEPRSSQWALLLHRANNTSVVLRRRDVDAVALDPIVRHYRAMADQRYSDRQARFSR